MLKVIHSPGETAVFPKGPLSSETNGILYRAKVGNSTGLKSRIPVPQNPEGIEPEPCAMDVDSKTATETAQIPSDLAGVVGLIDDCSKAYGESIKNKEAFGPEVQEKSRIAKRAVETFISAAEKNSNFNDVKEVLTKLSHPNGNVRAGFRSTGKVIFESETVQDEFLERLRGLIDSTISRCNSASERRLISHLKSLRADIGLVKTGQRVRRQNDVQCLPN